MHKHEPSGHSRGSIRIVKRYICLSTVIDDRLEWTVNMEACYKRANQRMYFLRKLKNFQLSNNLLYILYQSVAQSLLYNQVYSNYSNARKADWERLDSMTTVARTISRHDIRSPTAIYEEASLYKFMTIPCDRTHPLQTALSKARLNKAVHLKQSQNEQVHLHQGQDEQGHIHQGQDEQVHLHQAQDEQVQELIVAKR